MVRTYKKVLGGRRYQYYRAEQLEKAVQDVQSKKKSVRQAAEYYGVPKSTISDRIKGIHGKSVGGQTKIPEEEEERLVATINIAAHWGFPLTQYDIRTIVKSYLDKKGVNIPQFKHNLPGSDWMKLFLNRHKGLTTRCCQNIKRYRAQVNK